MAKIEWRFVNESGTNLNRYIATNVATGEEITFDLLRGGTISVVGTPLSASNLNQLIEAINAAYDLIINNEQNTTYTLTRTGDIVSLTGSDGKTNTFSLSDKLDKAQGSSQANKVALTDENGNIIFVDKIPSSKLPETGVSVDTAKNIESSSGTIISGATVENAIQDVNNLKENVNEVKNDLEKIKNEVNEDLTATIQCDHRYEITGDTGNEHGLAITDQQALIPKIKGRTLVKNNLIDGDFLEQTDWYASNNSFSLSDGVVTIINNEADANSYFVKNMGKLNNGRDTYIIGHQYFMSVDVYQEVSSWLRLSTNSQINFYFEKYYTYETNKWVNIYMKFVIPQEHENSYEQFQISRDFTAVGDTYKIKNARLVDLTLMYGAGNEPTDLQSILNDLDDDYSYNKGTFVHSNNTLVSTGRNLWDEKWENGYYYENNGVLLKATNNQTIRNKELIKVLPNKEYYIKCDDNSLYAYVFELDSNGDYISNPKGANTGTSGKFTTSNNASYICFFVQYDGDATYNNDICINVSDNNFNGTYEPYKEDVISGIGKLDAFESVANNTKTLGSGLANLGTLNWVYQSENNRFYTADLSNLIVKKSPYNQLICSKYTTGSLRDEEDKTIYIDGFGYIFIKDTSYTDAESLKTSLSGVMLAYEKETPTYEEITLPAGYAVAKGGMQIQQGTIPYDLTKEYSLNIKAQVLNNIEIDKQQQGQIDESKNILKNAGITGTHKVLKIEGTNTLIDLTLLFKYLRKNGSLSYTFTESSYANDEIIDWQLFNSWISNVQEHTMYEMLQDNVGGDSALVYVEHVSSYDKNNRRLINAIVIPTYENRFPTSITIEDNFKYNGVYKINLENDTYFDLENQLDNIPQFVSLTAYLDFPTTGNSKTFVDKNSFISYCENEQLYNYIFEQYNKVKVIGIMQDGQDMNGYDVLIQLGNAFKDTQGALTITYEFISISTSIIATLFFKLNIDGSITIEYSGDRETYRLVRKMDLKTINGQSLYGSGNIVIEGGSGSGSSVGIEDNLTSTSTTNALSANQGRVLNNRIANLENSEFVTKKYISEQGFATETFVNNKISNSIVNDLESTSTEKSLSAYQGNLLDKRITTLENSSGSGSNIPSKLLWSGNVLNQGLSAIALPTNYEKYKMFLFELDMISNDSQASQYGTITISVPFINAETSSSGYYSFYDFYTTRLFSAKVNLLGNGYYNLTLENMYVHVRKIYGIG